MNWNLKPEIKSIDIDQKYVVKKFDLKAEIKDVKQILGNIFGMSMINLTKIDDFFELIQKNQADGLVIKDKEKVISTGMIFYENKNAIIDLITVNEEYRGQKLGKKVFSELLKIIQQKQDIKSAFLISSMQAKNIYKSYGFKEKKILFCRIWIKEIKIIRIMSPL